MYTVARGMQMILHCNCDKKKLLLKSFIKFCNILLATAFSPGISWQNFNNDSHMTRTWCIKKTLSVQVVTNDKRPATIRRQHPAPLPAATSHRQFRPSQSAGPVLVVMRSRTRQRDRLEILWDSSDYRASTLGVYRNCLGFTYILISVYQLNCFYRHAFHL